MRELHVEVDGAVLIASFSPAEETVLVALHGAAAGTRDHPLYRHLHHVLPAADIGVVTYDRRGEGASEGSPSAGRFEMQARDALAVAAATGASRVGLWGWSQGAWVAPLAATMSDDVAFLVLIASTGVSPHEQMLFANVQQLQRAGYAPDIVTRVLDLRRLLAAWVHRPDSATGATLARDLSMASDEPWWELTYLPSELPDERERVEWEAEMTFDPQPTFEAVKVPTLLFYGADDGWTPVEASLAAWRLAGGGLVDEVVIPTASHELTLPDGSLAPEYEERLVEWCLARRHDTMAAP